MTNTEGFAHRGNDCEDARAYLADERSSQWASESEESHCDVQRCSAEFHAQAKTTVVNSFSARFVCDRSALDTAVADVVMLAGSGGSAAIIERLGEVPIEPKGKFEIIRNAVAHLGRNWVDDTIGFVELSLAVTQLQFALRSCGQAHVAPLPFNAPSVQILVAQEERHTFAACYLEELLRLEGWATELVDCDHAERVSDSAKAGLSDVVCLVWNDAHQKREVNSIVNEVGRIVSKYDILFISGGHAAMSNEGWLENRGLSDVCRSFDAALSLASGHVNRRTCKLPGPPPRLNEVGHTCP